jgi:hypothetical protein
MAVPVKVLHIPVKVIIVCRVETMTRDFTRSPPKVLSGKFVLLCKETLSHGEDEIKGWRVGLPADMASL